MKMKKIRLFTAMAVLLAAGTLRGQQSPRHVYLYEDFSTPGTYLDTAKWDIVGDTSYRSLYYAAFSNAGGMPPEAVWGYAPTSGMSRRMIGTYRLVSRPHAVPADARAYVAVRYDYFANVTSEEGVRSFGLFVRIAGGEWMACRTVGITKSTAAPARLVAELPAECRGEEAVQVAVVFQTRIDQANYTLYFDDIEFFAYPEQHYDLNFSWRGRPYTANRFDTIITSDTVADVITFDTLVTAADTLAVDLRLENTGNAMTSCKIAYTLDGGEPQTIPLAFPDTLMPDAAYTLSGFKPAGWEQAAKGHHTVSFRLIEANGIALSAEAVTVQAKTLSLIDETTFRTYAYKPLIEEFSSSSCGTCKPRNEALKPVFESLGDRISVVKYQMYWPGNGDPYYIEEGGIRKLFYDIYNVPEIFLNGRHDPASGGSAGMQARFAEKIGAASWFNLTLDTLALDNDTNIYIVCSLRASVPMDGLRLHTVVLEGQTEGNASTNKETEFHHVALKMLPDGKGQPVELKPDTVYTFRYAYDMKRTFMEEADDLKVVCFLQAADDSVMQSAIGDVKMRIASVPISPVANELKAACEILPVYPNPASETVYLHGLNAATVEVFNMAGRRVYRQDGVNGDLVLDVRHYRPGFYILYVREAGRTAMAKLCIIR